MAEAQILRQLAFNWLECQDEQGVFYFNQSTQQSSDTVPPELLKGAPVVSPRPTMKAKVISGGIGGLPQGATPPGSYIPQVQSVQVQQMHAAPMQQQVQQQMYMPQQMQVQQMVQQIQEQMVLPQPQQQVSYGSYQPAVQQQVVVLPQQVLQQPLLVPSYTPPIMVQPQVFAQPQQLQQLQPQTSPAVQKMAFGDWGVYEDELGRFYMQVSTGLQFEQAPPELNQAYQLYRAEQDQLHMLSMQQIEMQKQQIDAALAQQTNSLRMTFGMGEGFPIPA